MAAGFFKVSIPLVGESVGDCATLDAVLRSTRESGPRAPGTLDLLVSEAARRRRRRGPRRRGRAARRRRRPDAGGLRRAQTISLQRLNHVVPDRLKIHRLFVRGVVNAPERMALARSLIALSQTLNIVSVADGISTDADAQFFKWEGCDIGQGDALAPAALADVAIPAPRPPGFALAGSRLGSRGPSERARVRAAQAAGGAPWHALAVRRRGPQPAACVPPPRNGAASERGAGTPQTGQGCALVDSAIGPISRKSPQSAHW